MIALLLFPPSTSGATNVNTGPYYGQDPSYSGNQADSFSSTKLTDLNLLNVGIGNEYAIAAYSFGGNGADFERNIRVIK